MATTSMEKDFIIKDETAFKLFKDSMEKQSHNRKIQPSPSLERGRKKLKQFLSHYEN